MRRKQLKRELGEKEFILEFLEVYKSLPALWNSNCKAYNDKEIKSALYEQLVEKYRERYPSATRTDVSKKINILRTNYRKEVKRLTDAERIGEEASPTLYYYDAISFIGYSERGTKNTLDMSAMSDGDGSRSYTENPAKKIKQCPEDSLIELVSQKLSQPQDEDKKLCDGWAVLFKKLAPDQQIYAQKFIADILFEGQMGTLHRNSMEWNIIIEKDDSATEFEHMNI